jgi:transposase InsO family protein
VSVEETSTQVQVLFDRALIAEGLADLITPERVELPADDPRRPILLACSDNGPQMTSTATRQFLAGLAVAQRLGRPHTPSDQAWIESLFGHVKGEWPHLEQLADPAVLDTSWTASAASTTAPGSTPASATSPPTTNTTAAATPSAKHASRASGEPTNNDSPTIAGTATTTTPKRRHDLGHFPSDLRG